MGYLPCGVQLQLRRGELDRKCLFRRYGVCLKRWGCQLRMCRAAKLTVCWENAVCNFVNRINGKQMSNWKDALITRS